MTFRITFFDDYSPEFSDYNHLYLHHNQLYLIHLIFNDE